MKGQTKKLAVSALLLAADVILTRILAFNTPLMKIGLGFAATALCAMLYGPWWAAGVAALGDLRKPALPPGVDAGGHGGSHGYLGANFVEAILTGKTPIVNVAIALNTTVAGVVAHQSALKDGESLPIPQYEL